MPKIVLLALLTIATIFAVFGCSDTERVCPSGQRLDADGTDCVPILCEGDGLQDDECVCPDGQVFDEGMCVEPVDPCTDFSCDDGSPCTADACVVVSGMAVCELTPANDGATCTSDGVSGTCDAGSCVAAIASSCDVVDCDDSNSCTEDSCGSDDACSNVVLTDGTACARDDGAGVCESGSCVEPPAPCLGNPCDDGIECTSDVCTADGLDAVCENVNRSDGVACTAAGDVPGTCEVGVCVDLCSGVDCRSSNQCIEDGECNPDTGRCVAGPDEVQGAPCAENGGSVCDGSGACVECIDAGECAAGDACNQGVCGTDNECEYVPLTELAECSPDPGREACYAGICRPAPLDEDDVPTLLLDRAFGSVVTIRGTVGSPFDPSDDGRVQMLLTPQLFDRRVEFSIECGGDSIGLDQLVIEGAGVVRDCGDEFTRVLSFTSPLVVFSFTLPASGPAAYVPWSVRAEVIEVLD